MTDHTPEPWADYDNDLPKTLSAADYKRARVCVNACAGIPTEQLGDVKALIEALELTLATAAHFERQASRNSGGRRGGPVFQKARAALAPFRKN